MSLLLRYLCQGRITYPHLLLQTISSALSVAQDVIGLVPVVGPQLQSLCSLAIKVVDGLEVSSTLAFLMVMFE